MVHQINLSPRGTQLPASLSYFLNESWENICFECKEGGIGMLNLIDLVFASSVKLWWKSKVDNSLRSDFMQQKYRRDPKVVSVTKKRIQEVETWAGHHTEVKGDALKWKLSNSGLFSYSSCLQELKLHRISSLTWDLLWHNKNPKKISTLCGKMGEGCIPLDTRLKIFKSQFVHGVDFAGQK